MARAVSEILIADSRRHFMTEALAVEPIVDKDQAEEDLAMIRGIARRRKVRLNGGIARLEERVRDGNPVISFIAIAHARTQLEEGLPGLIQKGDDRALAPKNIHPTQIPSSLVLKGKVVTIGPHR